MNLRRICSNLSSLIAVVLFSCSTASAAAATSVASPDGTIVLTLHSNAPLGYSITVNGKPVLLRSRLGLELANDVSLGGRPVVERVARRSVDTHWQNEFGKNRDVRDHFNELTLTLRDGNLTFGVVARAYNDGVAFRITLPKQPGMDSFTVTRDTTEFTFPGDERLWAGWNNNDGPNRPEGGFIGSQEWRFAPARISTLNPAFKYGLPVLVQTPAAYVAITESDLLDWSGMWLVPKAGDVTTLQIQLAPPIPAQPWPSRSPAATNGAAVNTAAAPIGAVQKGLVVATTPHNSPWRTFIIARKPYQLVESDLVENLATPSQLADTRWIKPGMASWGTWWSATGQNNLDSLKQYIQLAADMDWPYQLSEIGDKSIVPDLVSFAKERGVRVWLWFHFNDFIDSAVYTRDFPMYAKWGIAGLKIDFIDRDDQWAVKWYEDVARTAAQNHLLIDFHGAFKPTGLERTWPNQITREGIQGNEYNKWSAKETPEHKATLPYTRGLAGPADYTPGGFINRLPSQFKIGNSNTQAQGTRASELAMFLLIQSPFIVACDSPSHYRNADGSYQPGMDFLKGLPTVWDETRGLDGEVGQYIVEARRNGTKWYLAAVSNSQARQLSVPLGFLGKGAWKVTLWQDAPDSGENAEHLAKDEKTVRSTDMLHLKLAPAGGTVAIFSPAAIP
ncbi:MAG: glycoside hydrolase family 97 protein [Acidobacteriaceae bacterium]|jgi:alpha-glucosidase